MADKIGDNLALLVFLLLTVIAVAPSPIFAGVEGEEKVGLAEEDDEAGAWTVMCKHLKYKTHKLI